MHPSSDNDDRLTWSGLVALRWLIFTVLLAALVAALSDGDAFWVSLSAAATVIVAFATRERQVAQIRPPRAADGVRLDPAAVVDALIEPALLLDRSGEVIAIGRRVRSVLPNAKPGVPLSFLLRDPGLLRALDDVRQSGREQAVPLQRPVSGRTLEAHLDLLRPAEGAPIVLLQFKDITHVQQIARMRTDFIANASHEMRTPLASILGFIETLQGAAKDDAPAREKFLGIMATQARRMSRLIDDLLSLSRLEERAHLRPTDIVDVAEIVRGVVDGLTPLASERGLKLVTALPSGRVDVLGDADELARVYVNLIENAVKYGGAPDGRVDISLTRQDGDVCVTVRDYGVGIPADHLPRLTERFYRVDTAHSRETGGTGLGLSLVRNTLSRHRGRLEIDSVEGEGARFTTVLPGA